MLLTMCKCKIHRATVTDTNINYEGSITIDERLMSAAGLLEYEQVQVLNVNNGHRFETYVMKGKKGEIIINGAAARLAVSNDRVIIIAYTQLKKKQATEFRPTVILVNEKNEILKQS